MKKLLIFGLIVLSVFLIYLCNMDKKVYYLALGDSLANGDGAYGKEIRSYSDYVSDYLKNKNLLETYVDEFAQSGYRTTDLINSITDNKKVSVNKKQVTLQNALIKADLVTVSIGANDILNKINTESPIDYASLYNYIDDLGDDLEELLSLMREYCKEDIVLVGYYNPYPYLNNVNTDNVFSYLNSKYEKISKEYDVIYVEISTLFKENPQFLPNENDIHPSKDGYRAISGEIISAVNKTLLKS